MTDDDEHAQTISMVDVRESGHHQAFHAAKNSRGNLKTYSQSALVPWQVLEEGCRWTYHTPLSRLDT